MRTRPSTRATIRLATRYSSSSLWSTSTMPRSFSVAKPREPEVVGILLLAGLVRMITPPIGLNLFVTAGITKMSIMQVVHAALPWTMVLLLFLVIITYVPAITLFLPNLLF